MLTYSLYFLYRSAKHQAYKDSQNILSIEDINIRKIGNKFDVDVMVVYSTFLDKATKKHELFHTRARLYRY